MGVGEGVGRALGTCVGVRLGRFDRCVYACYLRRSFASLRAYIIRLSLRFSGWSALARGWLRLGMWLLYISVCGCVWVSGCIA
nr:MAG TPA: hypothetical protein [Caudoviricetes sp.]